MHELEKVEFRGKTYEVPQRQKDKCAHRGDDLEAFLKDQCREVEAKAKVEPAKKRKKEREREEKTEAPTF